MRWERTMWIAAVLGCGVALARPASSGDDWSERSKALARELWSKVRSQAAAAESAVRREAEKVRRTPGIRTLSACDPVAWSDLGRCEERVVLLIHGLDEPGDIWDDLAPVLHEAGYAVARFDYPDDQPIAASADVLGEWLAKMQAAGVQRVDMVCHSMGGLVARDALTRSASGPRPAVERVIFLGTPAGGSPWARLQAVAEARQGVMRAIDKAEWRELLGFLNDGRGEAAADLLPGSAFLKDLDSRAWPAIQATAIVGNIFSPDVAQTRALDLLKANVSPDRAARAAAKVREFAAMLGDGVVPESSAAAPGIADVVRISATHRGIIRDSVVERTARDLLGQPSQPPPGIAIVLDRLALPFTPPPPPQ
jgi:pimeloyl-ACP methyl ester carboxylesterase